MRKRARYDPFADLTRDPLSPKLPRQSSGAVSGWGSSEDLTQELHALAAYVALSAEEDRARKDLLERIRGLIAATAPGCRCEPFGSWPAGLSSFDGDLDLSVAGGGLCLHALAARLRTEGWADCVEHVSRARVPVVTFQDRRSKLWCDVGLATANGHGTRSFLQRYARQHAAFQPVCLLLKLLLGQQRLHKAFQGGVSSYRVYVLVAHLLDTQQGASSLPAGELLQLALAHYSGRVDLETTSSLAADGGREVARFDAGTFQVVRFRSSPSPLKPHTASHLDLPSISHADLGGGRSDARRTACTQSGGWLAGQRA